MVSRWVDSEYIFTLLFRLLFSFMNITIETGDGTSICLTVKKTPQESDGTKGGDTANHHRIFPRSDKNSLEGMEVSELIRAFVRADEKNRQMIADRLDRLGVGGDTPEIKDAQILYPDNYVELVRAVLAAADRRVQRWLNQSKSIDQGQFVRE